MTRRRRRSSNDDEISRVRREVPVATRGCCHLCLLLRLQKTKYASGRPPSCSFWLSALLPFPALRFGRGVAGVEVVLPPTTRALVSALPPEPFIPATQVSASLLTEPWGCVGDQKQSQRAGFYFWICALFCWLARCGICTKKKKKHIHANEYNEARDGGATRPSLEPTVSQVLARVRARKDAGIRRVPAETGDGAGCDSVQVRQPAAVPCPA